MKQVILLLIMLFSQKCYSQNNSDSIIGKWLKIPKEDLIIEVYKSGKEYRGKIIWTKYQNKRNQVGFIIIEKLEYNSKKKIWQNGKIYDPNSGSSYNALIKIKSNGILELRAYKGMKFIGINKYFKRIK